MITLLSLGLALASFANAQSGCMQLTGSTMCPGFSQQYINPQRLSQEWSFFDSVNSVSDFDSQLQSYLTSTSPNGFRAEKYVQELGCSNTTSTYTLQYAQTFLCSLFTQNGYSAGCYSRTNVVRRMACQSTCLQFATSENYLIDDSLSCGPVNTAGSYRIGNLTADFTACTEWTTLATNNTDTCVLGQVNESNCGFGNSRTQLCNYCNPDGDVLVDSCCGSLNVDLTGCGYTLAASDIASTPVGTQAVLPTETGASSAEQTGSSTQQNHHSGLSGGAIAGIVIGCIVGVIKICLIVWVCCFRRKKNGHTISEEYGLFGAGRRASSDDDKSEILKEKSHSSPTSTQSPDLLKEKNKGSGSNSLDNGNNSGTPPNRLRGRLSLDSSAYTGSSAEARNLVSSYRDHYSTINIIPGSHVTAIYAYNPNLPDELRLEPEMTVRIAKIFDDGWAAGSVVGSDKPEGFFPLVVVTAAAQTDTGGYEAQSSAAGGNANASEPAPSFSRSNSFNSAASKPSAPKSDVDDAQSEHDPMMKKGTLASTLASKRRPPPPAE